MRGNSASVLPGFGAIIGTHETILRSGTCGRLAPKLVLQDREVDRAVAAGTTIWPLGGANSMCQASGATFLKRFVQS